MQDGGVNDYRGTTKGKMGGKENNVTFLSREGPLQVGVHRQRVVVGTEKFSE